VWRTVCAFIVEQDPPRRRVDIVELPRPDGPRKGCDRDAGKHQREWENHVQDRHVRSRKARDRKELASTVSELSGMTAAAINGWIKPVTARPPATRL